MEDKPIKLTLDVEEATLDEVKEDEVFIQNLNKKLILLLKSKKQLMNL